MEFASLEERCRQFIALMDRGAAAIEREDVRAIEAVAQESATLMGDMTRAWDDLERQAMTTSLAGSEAAVERLGRLMKEALARSDESQAMIARWMAQTQDSLRIMARGSAAMAGYAQAAGQRESVLSAKL